LGEGVLLPLVGLELLVQAKPKQTISKNTNPIAIHFFIPCPFLKSRMDAFFKVGSHRRSRHLRQEYIQSPKEKVTESHRGAGLKWRKFKILKSLWLTIDVQNRISNSGSDEQNSKDGYKRMILKKCALFILTFLFLTRPLLADDIVDTKTKPKTEPHPATMSLEDLGFSQDELQSDPQYQKELQARSDMLQIHQTLGLITAVPMTTEYVLGLVTAGNVANGSTNTELHEGLGIATTALYITTAMFAILAPKPKGLKPSGNTKTHVDLVWVHAPLMIAVPIMGEIVDDRVQNHQPLGDLGTIHGILATALVVSYLTSLTVITF
jgi:hypothetical protein